MFIPLTGADSTGILSAFAVYERDPNNYDRFVQRVLVGSLPNGQSIMKIDVSGDPLGTYVACTRNDNSGLSSDRRIYRRSGTNWAWSLIWSSTLSNSSSAAIASPAFRPGATSSSAYLAFGSGWNNSPGFQLLKITNSSVAALSIPAHPQTAGNSAPAWSGDGQYLISPLAASPFIRIDRFVNESLVIKTAPTLPHLVNVHPYPPFGDGTVFKPISGHVYDEIGNPISRTVRSHLRSNGALVDSTVSDPVTGEYKLDAYNNLKHQVIVLDDERNAMIYDHVMPVVNT